MSLTFRLESYKSRILEDFFDFRMVKFKKRVTILNIVTDIISTQLCYVVHRMFGCTPTPRHKRFNLLNKKEIFV